MSRPLGRRTASTSLLCLSAVMAGLFVVGTPVSAASGASHHTYYVDCARGDDADNGSSPDRAWRTLAKVDSLALQGGDAVLFRRSTTCHGTFEPHGSGTTAHPIVAGAYGDGAPPVLDGDGARTAVFLNNVQGWLLHDLAVTDPGPTGTPGLLRTGIEVLNDRPDIAHGLAIENDHISRVDSNLDVPPGASYENYSKASGAIEFTCDPMSGFVCAAGRGFSGVTIAHNVITSVSREGIYVFGAVRTRDLVIRSNLLRDIGGDGIVADDSVGARIEGNVVDGFNVGGAEANAGIWAYDSTGDIFEYNDVSHGKHGPLDSMAYDIDGEDAHLLFQYNVSSDNSGGFLMICNTTGAAGNSAGGSVVRYNISDDDYALDGRGIIDAPNLCSGERNISIYNNTIYSTNPLATTMFENANHSTVHFVNNIFAGPDPTTRLSDRSSTFQHNLYFDVTCSVSRPDTRPVTANPDLVDPDSAVTLGRAQGFRLRARSPALRSGESVPDNGGRDFFGNPVPAHGTVTIGAYQGRGVAVSGGQSSGGSPGCGR